MVTRSGPPDRKARLDPPRWTFRHRDERPRIVCRSVVKQGEPFRRLRLTTVHRPLIPFGLVPDTKSVRVVLRVACRAQA